MQPHKQRSKGLIDISSHDQFPINTTMLHLTVTLGLPSIKECILIEQNERLMRTNSVDSSCHDEETLTQVGWTEQIKPFYFIDF